MKPPLEHADGFALAGGHALEKPEARPSRRRRGRPLDVPPEVVLDRIRKFAAREVGLFRVHLTDAPLYARARRLFGSWQGAVRAAGLDYHDVLENSRRRSLRSRRARRPGQGTSGRAPDVTAR